MPGSCRPVLSRALAVLSACAVALVCLAVPSTASTAPLPPGSRALTVSAAAASGDRAARPGDGTICYYGACYNYVAGRQYADASGAEVTMRIARPELDQADRDGHSLQELAVQSADGTQIVEVGWTVDRGLNGDAAPHLFVYHWVDGATSCYNGCGFVPTSGRVRAGMRLPAGTLVTLRINHAADRWRISVDGSVFGYFPDTLWGGRFTRLGLVQAFGEVASTSVPTCNDMGTGHYAGARRASVIERFRLLDSTTPIGLSMLVTSPRWYTAAAETPTSFRLGGPGDGACTAA